MRGTLVVAALVAAILIPTGSAQAAGPTTPTQLQVASVSSSTSQVVTAVAGTKTCWGYTRTMTAKSIVGLTLFTYSTRIEWCGQNGRIVGTPYRTRWGNTWAAFWTFNGHIGNSSINRGTSFSAFTQGSFTGCTPLVGAVCVSRQPYINLTVYPNGFVTGNSGG